MLIKLSFEKDVFVQEAKLLFLWDKEYQPQKICSTLIYGQQTFCINFNQTNKLFFLRKKRIDNQRKNSDLEY